MSKRMTKKRRFLWFGLVFLLLQASKVWPVQPEASEKYAVVIGITDYRHKSIPDVRYAKADAQSIYRFLTDPKKGRVKKSNVRMLLDEEATLTSMKTELGYFLSKNARKQDTVIIYFAGHGAPEVDFSGNADDGMSKYILPCDADPGLLYATALDMRELGNIFKRINAERIVCYLDCCYGGTGGRSFSIGDARGRGVAISNRFLADLSGDGSGRVVVTASRENEIAIEVDELKAGLFTHYLLKALEGGADYNRDGSISVKESYDFVSEKVSSISRQYGGNQHPQMFGELTGSILLSRYGAPLPMPVSGEESFEALLARQQELETRLVEINEGKNRRIEELEKTIRGLEKQLVSKERDKQVAKQNKVQIDTVKKNLQDEKKRIEAQELLIKEEIEIIKKKKKKVNPPISF